MKLWQAGAGSGATVLGLQAVSWIEFDIRMRLMARKPYELARPREEWPTRPLGLHRMLFFWVIKGC